MKLNEGWILAEIQNEYMAVPVGANADEFAGVVRLNESGRDIWDGLAKGLDEQAIARMMVQKYAGLRTEKALEGIRRVTDMLRTEGLLQ